MNEMQDLFEIEKKFSVYEKNIAISIFVYYFFIFVFGRYRSLQEFFFAVLTIAVLMIDYYIGKKKVLEQKIRNKNLQTGCAVYGVCCHGVQYRHIFISDDYDSGVCRSGGAIFLYF